MNADKDGEAAVTAGRQVLVVQGGGAGVHDEWDLRLVQSLRRHLGPGFDVRYPRMPVEGDPDPVRWGDAIASELADLDEGAVVVGHSIGGTLLVHTLAERALGGSLGAIVLVAAPFVGRGGWPNGAFEFALDLGGRLPAGVPVHVVHGLDDDTAPPDHAERYGEAIPQARVHLLPGRDHQLGGDLREVAAMIRTIR